MQGRFPVFDTMTKNQLIEALSKRQPDLSMQDVRLAVDIILESISSGLEEDKRVEIRGFGSLSLRYRPPRKGRNPKTGEPVSVDGKYFPYFKPGRELRARINSSIDGD